MTSYVSAEHPEHPWRDEELMRELYEDRMLTASMIAEGMPCHKRTVFEWINRHDIEKRSRGENVRLAVHKNNPAHYMTDFNGYERWETWFDYERYFVFVHRLQAVAEFGFDAVCDMHIHHKNGIRWDNRPENLELVTPSEHKDRHPVTERRADGTAVKIGLVRADGGVGE